jgi:hypothetical protein
LLAALTMLACARESPRLPPTAPAPTGAGEAAGRDLAQQPIPTAAPAPPTAPPALPSPAVAPTAPRQGAQAALNLRTVDWTRVVTTDPNLTARNVPTPPGSPLGPFVETKDGKLGGHAATRDVLYGDLSGDGQEEAVIPLNSGGTAGDVGLLVYGAAAGSPTLVTTYGGYKLAARIEGGHLVVDEPLYAGWEPNCCPSGASTTRLRLQGNALAQVDRTDRGHPEMRPPTVDKFYALIGERKYREAYAFLSPTFQAANPYDRWVAGFQDTLSVTSESRDLPGEDAVAVDITATDRTAAGGQVTRRFRGRWTVVWSAQARQWLLDRAQIQAQ